MSRRLQPVQGQVIEEFTDYDRAEQAGTKANQVASFAYVRDLLVRFSDKPSEPLAGLLPDQWLKTHSECRRRWSR